MNLSKNNRRNIMRVFKYTTNSIRVKEVIEKNHKVEVSYLNFKENKKGIDKESFYLKQDHEKVDSISFIDDRLTFKFKNEIITKERQKIILNKMVDLLTVVYNVSKDEIYNDLILSGEDLEDFYPPVFTKFLTPKLLEKVDIYNLVVKKFFKCSNCKQFMFGHRPKTNDKFDKSVIPFSGRCHIDYPSNGHRFLQVKTTYGNQCCKMFKPVKLVEKRIMFRIHREVSKLEKIPFKFPKDTPNRIKQNFCEEKEYSVENYKLDLQKVNFCKFVQNKYERAKNKLIVLYDEEHNDWYKDPANHILLNDGDSW